MSVAVPGLYALSAALYFAGVVCWALGKFRHMAACRELLWGLWALMEAVFGAADALAGRWPWIAGDIPLMMACAWWWHLERERRTGRML